MRSAEMLSGIFNHRWRLGSNCPQDSMTTEGSGRKLGHSRKLQISDRGKVWEPYPSFWLSLRGPEAADSLLGILLQASLVLLQCTHPTHKVSIPLPKALICAQSFLLASSLILIKTHKWDGHHHFTDTHTWEVGWLTQNHTVRVTVGLRWDFGSPVLQPRMFLWKHRAVGRRCPHLGIHVTVLRWAWGSDTWTTILIPGTIGGLSASDSKDSECCWSSLLPGFHFFHPPPTACKQEMLEWLGCCWAKMKSEDTSSSFSLYIRYSSGSLNDCFLPWAPGACNLTRWGWEGGEVVWD